jgi:hypothetical protein
MKLPAWLLVPLAVLAGCASAGREPAAEPAGDPAAQLVAAERELERQRGALTAATADGRPPDCPRAAALSDNICALADRICVLAPRAAATQAAERCQQARRACQAARQRVAASCHK